MCTGKPRRRRKGHTRSNKSGTFVGNIIPFFKKKKKKSCALQPVSIQDASPPSTFRSFQPELKFRAAGSNISDESPAIVFAPKSNPRHPEREAAAAAH